MTNAPVRVTLLALMSTVTVLLSMSPGLSDEPLDFYVDPPPHDFDNPYVASPGPQIPTTELNHPYGGQHDTTGRREFLQRVYASGVRWVYVWVTWSDVQPEPNVYRWDALDRFLTTAEDVGINVVVQVHVGAWSRPQTFAGPTRANSLHPSSPTVAYEDFGPAVDFWRALVGRYMPGGALARERGWEDYGVRVWEVENEPDQVPLPWWGSWAVVPKDFAAYLSQVVPSVRELDEDITIAAPALNHEDEPSVTRGGGVAGLRWLDEMLTPGSAQSEWASDTYRRGDSFPDPVPLVDLFSFHRNNVDVATAQVAERAREVRQVVTTHLARHPERTARLYYSEGNALSYDPDAVRYARAQSQLAVQALEAGVERLAFDHGSHINDEDWTSSPVYRAFRVITTLFPEPGHVERADDLIDPERVTTYRRADPATGVTTLALWAHDLPMGTGPSPGPPFVIDVPVPAGEAIVVGPDHEPRPVTVEGSSVQIELFRDDPSPVVFVTWRGDTLNSDEHDQSGPEASGARPGPSKPARELPATGARELPATGTNPSTSISLTAVLTGAFLALWRGRARVMGSP